MTTFSINTGQILQNLFGAVLEGSDLVLPQGRDEFGAALAGTDYTAASAQVAGPP